jgi:uncharacterized membrane protein YhaH (DUF805 family)
MGDVMEWMLMPLKRYADFSGRSRRQEYWSWVLFQVIIYVAVLVLMVLVGGSAMMTGDVRSAMAVGGIAMIVIALYAIWELAVIIPSIAVAVRRLHDTNRSGWWILAPLVPYLVAFVAAIGGVSSGSGSGVMAAGLITMLCMLAALVLGIVLLVFMFLDGTPGANRYGPDPKGRGEAAVFA